MCLHVENNYLQTALTDMTVYKVIFKDNISVHRCFRYCPNTLYRLRKSLLIAGGKVHAGFHSYIEKVNVKLYENYYKNKKVVKFTIPKGAKYYTGRKGDIVSTSIRSGSLRNLL